MNCYRVNFQDDEECFVGAYSYGEAEEIANKFRPGMKIDSIDQVSETLLISEKLRAGEE